MLTISAQIKLHYNKATILAVNHVVKLARQILTDNSNLQEFVMGMGVYHFTDKEGRVIYSSRKEIKGKSLETLDDFISEWDDYLKITGYPLRFTVQEKITNW